MGSRSHASNPARPLSRKQHFGRGIALLSLAAAIGCAGGCANVPDTKFLRGQYDARQAVLRDAWGPISDRAKAALLANLKPQAGNPDLLERQIAIEQAVAGTPLAVGNKITLLLDGPATYQAMFAAMRQAQRSINIEFYIIEDDDIGRKFADVLLQRRAAGVEINLIYDSVGTFKTPKEFFERLRQAGVRIVEFNPVKALKLPNPWKLNHRDHRKQVIIDGRTVFLGGINIDDVYAHSSSSGGGSSGSASGASGRSPADERRGGWRDTDIQIDGPAVAEFQKLFLQSWEKQRGPPLRRDDYFPLIPPQGKEIVRAIGTSPDDRFSASYMALLAALTHAQKQAYITNAYFVPDPQLVAALVDAAQRGVDVRLVLPSTTDSRSAAYAAHSHYDELLRGGVKIYERKRALLHAKTAVIDGVWSRVGSSNLDWRSAVDNDELDAVVLSAEFNKRMLATYALDEAQSDEITLEAWHHRPFRARFKEWFFRVFGRLL